MAVQLLTRIYRTDVTDLLPGIRVPTLVLHRQRDRAIPFRLGRDLAALILNAGFVPLEGRIHLPMFGDSQSVLHATAEFLGVAADPARAEPAAEPAASGLTGAAEPLQAQEGFRLLSELEVVSLSRFRVVGDYTRYDEAARNALKDARQRIMAGLEHPQAVEKMALYYVALSSRLPNVRQLREFAVGAIERVPSGEDRVKYDHLEFALGISSFCRDLAVTNDFRSLFGEIAVKHLGVPASTSLFPGYSLNSSSFLGVIS